MTWKCWPCSLGGDAAELVKRKNGVTFPEAVRLVAETVRHRHAPWTNRKNSPEARDLGPTVGKPEYPSSPPPERSTGLPLADALALVTDASGRLWTPKGTEALTYLRGRKLIRRGDSRRPPRGGRIPLDSRPGRGTAAIKPEGWLSRGSKAIG